MRLVYVMCFLAACTDYDLNAHKPDPVPPEDTDTGTLPDDTAEPVDTADTAEPDSGIVEVPDEEVATEAVYVNTSTELFSFDPNTGIATRIGTFTDGGRPIDGGMTDIAIDLDGIMFGGSYDALYRINASTAECTFVGYLDDSMTGLTFVSDGRLVGAGAAVSFVDTRNGNLTPLVPMGEYTTSGDIIGLPDGMLYWTVTGGDGLVQVDPDSGTTRRRGTVGVTGVFGLGYAYGELYGFTDDGEVITIDASSGRSTGGDRLSGTWWGATTNPVLW
ncbi:MAG: hypothetical protein ACK4YP_04935 [Myxococcota bacterium]